MSYTLGIDIGKTYTKAVGLDEDSTVLFRRRYPTDLSSKDALLASLKQGILENTGGLPNQFLLGICLPGMINFHEQCLIEIPSYPGFPSLSRTELATHLCIGEERLVIDNDCNAAVYGEMKMGNLQTANNAILLSLGTGIGIGIIIGGTVFRGSNGYAGQIGHMKYDMRGSLCKCGRRGCYETYLCDYDRIVESNKDTPADRETEGLIGALGSILSFSINLVNPDHVLFSGYPFQSKNFLGLLLDRVKEHTFPRIFAQCQWECSRLDSWAGAVGAALMAVDQAYHSGTGSYL